MALTIKHAKTDTIADWTQADLDAQIAAGNFPPGTLLADIVLPSDWNNDHTLSGTVPIANGGTGQTTANAALNALLPSQTSNNGKVLSTDGTNTSWIAAGGTGTVTSVTGTAPVSVATGTTTPVISMHVANSTNDGYLSSTDWSTFNSKAPATSGTSILYGNGSGGFSNVTVGTGLSFSAGTLTATGSGMVYPGAGIPNSTGTSWGTSYTTTGSGTIVALQTNPTLYNPNIDVIDFDTAYATTLTAGQLGWDSTNNALAYGMAGGNIIQHIGEDQYLYIKASSAITKGQVIMFTGSVGASGVLTGAPATGITDGTYIMGVAAESIANNGFGFVQTFGVLTNVNTSAFADGDILWYNPSVAGGLTATKPSAPNIKAQVAACNKGGSSGGGVITVRVNPGSQLGGTDSNVQLTSPSNGQLLSYDGVAGYWKNTSLTAGTGISTSATAGVITVTNTLPDQTVSITGSGGAVVTGTYPNFTITTPSGTVTSVTGTAPIVSSGGATPAISITQATTSTNGYLSSTDWNTFNGKQAAYTNLTTFGSLVNATGWLYNNGTGTLSYSTPTASDVGAVPTSRTISTTAPLSGGGALSSNLTLSMPAASASQNGYLTSTDWSTFNSKGSGSVTSVSVVSANGLAGTVATATSTPAITLSTTITGILKGNGTAISAATSGTDYAPATSGTSILYGNGSGGFSNVTIGSGLSFSTGTLTATSATPSVVNKTANYTLTTSDGSVFCNATSAAFTITLPTAVGVGGQIYIIKKTDNSTNAITIATTSSQTIDGLTTQTLGLYNAWIVVQSDGTNWQIIG